MSVPPWVSSFVGSEAALRAAHGIGTLIVKPKVHAVPSVPGGLLAVGGWAFLDGDPAVLPDRLDVIVVVTEGPSGVENHGRAAGQVLHAVAPYTTHHTTPCPHLAVRVPEAARDALLARLVALPDYVPGRPAAPELFPVLKEAGWAHRALCVTMPLPGVARADAPIVAFAEDGTQGYRFLTREEAPDADPTALLRDGVANLRRRKGDFVVMSEAIAVSAGADLSAERLLDAQFLGALHGALGSDTLFVCAPHRVALYALRAGAPAAALEQFTALVRFDAEHGPAQGHAPVSTLAFRVVEGAIAGAVTLDELPAALSPPTVEPEPELPAWPGVTHPRDLAFVDFTRKEINAGILVFGAGAKAFARALHAAGGGEPWGAPVDKELEHFTLRLGDIRGFTPRLYLYALEDTAPTALALAPHTKIVILVQQGAAHPALAAVAARARESGATLAFVGPAPAAAAFEPAVSAPFDDAAPLTVFKACMKVVFASLRKA
jgi:hypothetical protein